MDPLAGSAWSAASTVAGFVASAPNATLMRFADSRWPHGRAVDIGCGAGRNTIPLAEFGWEVIGVDLSRPMLEAAVERARDSNARDRIGFALAPMDALPIADRSADLIVAHGIWNLARSGAEFRRGVREAARIARRGAALFVFTFSRRTLRDTAQPIADETFVFTDFSGEPQVFLTAEQLTEELAAGGFTPDPAVPLTEHNVPRPGAFVARGGPVIYEAAYRFTS
jgi:ubiquinone/menaquinone biosynthesis C-methylase UbiE